MSFAIKVTQRAICIDLWGGSGKGRRIRDSIERGPLPVSSNVRLITHASKRNPVKLSAQGLGHWSSHTCFTNPRRADKAQNGALQVVFQLPDSQVFQHSLLQFFHGIMVIIQQNAGCSNVQAICQVTQQKRSQHMELFNGRTPFQTGKSQNSFLKKEVIRTGLVSSQWVFRKTWTWFSCLSIYRNNRYYIIKNSLWNDFGMEWWDNHLEWFSIYTLFLWTQVEYFYIFYFPLSVLWLWIILWLPHSW